MKTEKTFWIQNQEILLPISSDMHPSPFSFFLANSFRLSQNDPVVVDVGCGCGIHSVLAAKLGGRHVIAVDIRQSCVDATSRLADLNGVTNIVAASINDLLSGMAPDSIDQVLCNPPTMPRNEHTPEFTWGGQSEPTEFLVKLIRQSSLVLKVGGSLQFVVSSIIPNRIVRSELKEAGFAYRVSNQQLMPIRRFYDDVYDSEKLRELDNLDRDLYEVLSFYVCDRI